jgi:acid phosphatase
LGGAIDPSLYGTTDSMYYNHYSTIASVSVNWGLPSLGRWDCDANVLALVANKTGYKNTPINTANLYFNSSYPGPLNDAKNIPGWWPYPDTLAKCASSLGVLDSVVSTWGKSSGTYNYTNIYLYDTNAANDIGSTPITGSTDSGNSSGGSGSGGSPTTSSTPAATTSNPANLVRPDVMALFGVVGLIIALL